MIFFSPLECKKEKYTRPVARDGQKSFQASQDPKPLANWTSHNSAICNDDLLRMLSVQMSSVQHMGVGLSRKRFKEAVEEAMADGEIMNCLTKLHDTRSSRIVGILRPRETMDLRPGVKDQLVEQRLLWL